jgi:hypothetical protein
MLRELHELLVELQEAMAPLAGAARAGQRLQTASLDLPLDIVPVLRGGGCVLLADVPRNSADGTWKPGAPTRLKLSMAAAPLSGEGL